MKAKKDLCMKGAKRITAVLLALVLALSLAACGEAPVSEEGNVKMQSVDLWSDDNIEPCDPAVTKGEDGSLSYTIRTKRYSHWYLDENGGMEKISDTKLRTGDDWYAYDVELSNKNTAFIVMDPWVDWADDYLNEYFGAVTQKTTLPLMQAAAESGHAVIVLTNDPSKVTYNTKIDPGLQALVDEGKAELFYHTDYPMDKFVEYLDGKGIENLVYTGYASNMCVLFRELGIARMTTSGKQLFFIPDCSAAMEHADTWETQEVHKATTLAIGQTQARLIEFEDIYNAIK